MTLKELEKRMNELEEEFHRLKDKVDIYYIKKEDDANVESEIE